MSIEANIYAVARAGTDVNPAGLPDPLAKLVVSQTKHETATSVAGKMQPYTSNAFTKDNNAFGYKYVGSRYQEGPGIRSSEGDAYGHYASYEDSVMELVDWIYRRVREGKFPADLASIRTAEQYAGFLKKSGYYGDNQGVYQSGLERWFTSDIGKVTTGIGGLVVVGIGIYLLTKLKRSA